MKRLLGQKHRSGEQMFLFSHVPRPTRGPRPAPPLYPPQPFMRRGSGDQPVAIGAPVSWRRRSAESQQRRAAIISMSPPCHPHSCLLPVLRTWTMKHITHACPSQPGTLQCQPDPDIFVFHNLISFSFVGTFLNLTTNKNK